MVRFLALLVGLLAVACGETDPSEEVTPCAQYLDADTYGCADIAGTVVDSSGRPLEGAVILAESDTIVRSLQARSDARGAYALRVYQLRSPLAGQLHAVDVRIWAAPPPGPNPPGELNPSDTVSVHVQFEQIGVTPVVARADTMVIPATSN